VSDYSIFDPVCRLGIGPTVGFEVMNLHGPWQRSTVNVEPVLFPIEGEGSGEEGESEEEGDESREESFHFEFEWEAICFPFL
jgi:hypothetical protein